MFRLRQGNRWLIANISAHEGDGEFTNSRGAQAHLQFRATASKCLLLIWAGNRRGSDRDCRIIHACLRRFLR